MARLTARIVVAAVTTATLSCGCYQASMVPVSDRALAIARPLLESHAPAAAELPSASTLTREQLVARALAHDPALAELRAKAVAEAARVADAGDPDNPELRFTDAGFNDFDGRAGVALRVKPPLPGVLQAQKQAARARADRALAAVERAEQVVAVRVGRSFDHALVLQAAAQLRERAADVESRRLDVLQRQLAHGLVTRVDVAEDGMTAARARQESARAAARLREARAALLESVALPVDAPLALEGEVADPAVLDATLSSERDSIERALRARPDVRAAAAGIDAAKAERWIEGAERWPWLSFVQVGYDLHGSAQDAWSAGLAVELPIFDPNADGVHRAQADTAVAEREFEGTVHDIATRVRDCLRRAHDAAAEVQQFRDGPLAAAADTRAIVAQAKDAGQVNDADVLAAEARWIEAKQEELELIDAYLLAYGDLVAEVGPIEDSGGAAAPR